VEVDRLQVPTRRLPLRNETFVGSQGAYDVLIKYGVGEGMIMQGVGVDILKLSDGTRSIAEITAELSDTYDVDSDTILNDAIAFLAHCRKEGIVRLDTQKTNRQVPTVIHDSGLSLVSARYRKPIPGSPLAVFWEITNTCNLKCIHCYKRAGKAEQNELSTKECLQLVREMGKMHVMRVNFGGGEPLLRKDLLRIIRATKKAGMMTGLTTNGTLLTKEIASQLAKLGVPVQVSLDGARATTHERIRGKSGSYQQAIDAIHILTGLGVDTRIGTVVMRPNLNEIPRMPQVIQSLGVKIWNLMLLIPVGRATKSLMISPSQLKDLATELKAIRSQFPELIFPDITGKFGLQRQENEGDRACLLDSNQGYSGCAAAHINLGISPQGYVRPCDFIPPSRANDNVREKSLSEIWINGHEFEAWRNIQIRGKCLSCPRFEKGCRAGCRAAAYGYWGDYGQSDPYCFIDVDNESGHPSEESSSQRVPIQGI